MSKNNFHYRRSVIARYTNAVEADYRNSGTEITFNPLILPARRVVRDRTTSCTCPRRFAAGANGVTTPMDVTGFTLFFDVGHGWGAPAEVGSASRKLDAVYQARSEVMKRNLIYAAVIATLLPAMAQVAYAADQDRTRDQDQLQTQDKDQTRDQDRLQDKDQLQDRQIYGSQLMTQQERNEYRARMRAAKTVQEREQIRNEHHERMKERAKERGVTLPDTPPPRGMGGGMGPGGGMGGMGPGSGRR
jgi:hypothetical protein